MYKYLFLILTILFVSCYKTDFDNKTDDDIYNLSLNRQKFCIDSDSFYFKITNIYDNRCPYYKVCNSFGNIFVEFNMYDYINKKDTTFLLNPNTIASIYNYNIEIIKVIGFKYMINDSIVDMNKNDYIIIASIKK